MNAIATFSKKVKGYVSFHQCHKSSKDTIVQFNLYNLTPNKTFAIHIHEYGDERTGCTSLGSHWNPYNQNHGNIFINRDKRHAGDLINNLTSDKNGTFTYTYKDNLLRVYDPDSIIGRSVVIHYGIDDLGLGNNLESLKTGNAGGRMDCAVIGFMNPDV